MTLLYQSNRTDIRKVGAKSSIFSAHSRCQLPSVGCTPTLFPMEWDLTGPRRFARRALVWQTQSMTHKPDYIEGDPTEPLTRGEFSEAMQAVARSFDKVATKDELRTLEARMFKSFATKEDLQQLGNRVDRLSEKIDANAAASSRQLNAVAETINRNVARTMERFLRQVTRELQLHHRRLAVVEDKLRITPPR